jgi:predicted nuclease of predicted toxin-antitoxin system
MTQFLADENIPPAVVKFLRNKGLDVKEVREFGVRSPSDAVIMEFARQEQRILLTFDKHFANTLLYPLSTHHGVIRVREFSDLAVIQGFVIRCLIIYFQKLGINLFKKADVPNTSASASSDSP